MLDILSVSWTALPCGCYILSEADNISMLPISDYAWPEQQFIQVVSTFADVYFKDVSAPLESICYLRGILKKPRWSKQDKMQDKIEERKKQQQKKTTTTTTTSKQLGQIQTHYAKDLYSK